MDPFLVPVIYGSVRRERQGIKAARYIVRRLRELGCNPVLVDPLEKPLPMLDLMYKEYAPGTAPPVMEELAQLFRKADGFVVVSGEYNQSIPPALSNTLDHYLEEYFWRPAGIASYSNGRFSGARAAYALRSMLAEMGMVTMPSMLQVGGIQNAFDDEGVPADPKMDSYTKTFFDELLWYMRVMRPARAQGVPY
jgi:NAD(P)H-dependent FMN reductase